MLVGIERGGREWGSAIVEWRAQGGGRVRVDYLFVQFVFVYWEDVKLASRQTTERTGRGGFSPN